MLEVLGRAFSSELFIAVVSGVVLVVFSQYFSEFIVRPRLALRERIAKLNPVMLRNQPKYLSAKLDPVEIDEIREASTGLVTAAWLVYWQRNKRMKYLNVAREINGILAHSIAKDTENTQVYASVRTIESLDRNFKVAYFDTKVTSR